MDVYDDDSGLPPFDELASGTVTFEGTAGDFYGAGGLDATTIPVRMCVTDNVGNSNTQIVTLTLDTAPPRGFEPVEFSDEFGYHFDLRTDVLATWRLAAGGSGTV